jgi:hypothetical protein
MTTEEHVATAETHLRYAEGHLQPTEEHMADAEVHLKLVKAHLAALAAVEPPEVEVQEMENLPLVELAGGKADTARRITVPGEGRSPTWSGTGKRTQRRKAPPGSGGASGMPHEGVPGLSDSPPG